MRTRAGRELGVGHVPGDPEGGIPGGVLLDVVLALDEHGGVLRAGLTPGEARRLARALLVQADHAEAAGAGRVLARG
jgi:hypothetical protein